MESGLSNFPIAITGLATLSAKGINSYKKETASESGHFLSFKEIGGQNAWVGSLHPSSQPLINNIKSNKTYKGLDPTVWYAICCARNAIEQSGWSDGLFGVNIGSSRGATTSLEQAFVEFIETQKVKPSTSPNTTLGNISSWVAHDLRARGPAVSHSITCSTALHALLNGIAWMRSGMAKKFLVGGSEASLTPFTMAQMRALKILTPPQQNLPWPCRSFDLKKTTNTMVPSEGAAIACLENGESKNALAYIKGIGYATETLKHGGSISKNGINIRRAMLMALEESRWPEVDMVIAHGAGTIKGDKAEFNAINTVFGNKIPKITTNKYEIGHTLGASGLLSIATGIGMLQKQRFVALPYKQENNSTGLIKNILINAVGFGGNALSVIISKKA